MTASKKCFIQLMLLCLVLVTICEIIGTHNVPLGPFSIVLFPMLYAVVIGLAITPDLLGKKIAALKKIVGEKEVDLAGEMVGISLVLLGIKYGTTVGPNLQKILQAGLAFISQEFGHLLAPLLALPLAILLGMKREAIGATASISREPALGLISQKFGISSPEGSGVLGTYLVGTVVGTLYFSFLGSVCIYSGLHPYALGMACGVGSASMMTAASAALSTMVPPDMAETVVAYAATSNMMSSISGIIFLTFISIPLTEKLYLFWLPKLAPKKKQKKGAHS